MLISGILMNFKAPIWQFTMSQIDISVILYLAFGIILGTAMAFFFFIKSLNYLSAKETTLFGTIEPVMAIVASALWLKVVFLPFQLLGIVLIIILILALSLKRIKNDKYVLYISVNHYNTTTQSYTKEDSSIIYGRVLFN